VAVRTLTATPLDTGTNVKLVTWTGLLNGDTGQPMEMPDYGDLTVTVEGTFSTGGSITLEGSNNGTNYYALTDGQGNAITKTTAGIEAIIETPRYIRPNVTAGDGTTALQCRILARRGSR
jgi:hypothetical protein